MRQELSKSDREASKRYRILTAAKKCFLDYGFKKTSMSDIAKQADMSRPALYLHFDNKETIFCEMVEQLHQQTLAEAATVLEQKHLNIIERLNKAFECRTVFLFATVNDSTHGSELTDINNKIAFQINRTSIDRFVQLISQTLTVAESKNEIQLKKLDLTATQAAELLVNSASGIKQAATSTEDFRARLKRLISMFEWATVVR